MNPTETPNGATGGNILFLLLTIKNQTWNWIKRNVISDGKDGFKISSIKNILLLIGSIIIFSTVCAYFPYKFFSEETRGKLTIGDYEQGLSALFSGLAFFYLIVTYETQKEELGLTRTTLDQTKEAMQDQVEVSSFSSILQSIPVLIDLEMKKIASYNFMRVHLSIPIVPGDEKILEEIKWTEGQIVLLEKEIAFASNAIDDLTKDDGNLFFIVTKSLNAFGYNEKFETTDQTLEFCKKKISEHRSEVRSGLWTIESYKKILGYFNRLEETYSKIIAVKKPQSHRKST